MPSYNHGHFCRCERVLHRGRRVVFTWEGLAGVRVRAGSARDGVRFGGEAGCWNAGCGLAVGAESQQKLRAYRRSWSKTPRQLHRSRRKLKVTFMPTRMPGRRGGV